MNTTTRWNKALELQDYNHITEEVALFEGFQQQYGPWMLISAEHRRWEYAEVYQCITSTLPKGAECLEIGGSAGRGQGTPLAPSLALAGYPVCVSDLNLNAQLAVEEQSLRLGISNLTFFREDATALTKADESFDCVYSISVLEHIPDDEKAISECIRVLRPNGLLTFTFDYCHEPVAVNVEQLRLYTKEDVQSRIIPLLEREGMKLLEEPSFDSTERNVYWAGTIYNFAILSAIKK